MVADITIGPGRNMLNMSGNMKRTRKTGRRLQSVSQ